MLIGYARVSTDDQNLDLQQQALAAAGCTEIFTDQVSGAASRRLGLDNALARCGAGDVLVVMGDAAALSKLTALVRRDSVQQ